MIGIIAVNNKGYIGKDNKLMWHSSDDLKHFKAMRKDKLMLVGYNTWLELPQFLKDHKDIIVDNRGISFSLGPTCLCIGGKKTYEKYMHLYTELHISFINDDQIGDVKVPDWENLNPECIVYHYDFEVNK